MDPAMAANPRPINPNIGQQQRPLGPSPGPQGPSPQPNPNQQVFNRPPQPQLNRVDSRAGLLPPGSRPPGPGQFPGQNPPPQQFPTPQGIRPPPPNQQPNPNPNLQRPLLGQGPPQPLRPNFVPADGNPQFQRPPLIRPQGQGPPQPNIQQPGIRQNLPPRPLQQQLSSNQFQNMTSDVLQSRPQSRNTQNYPQAGGGDDDDDVVIGRQPIRRSPDTQNVNGTPRPPMMERTDSQKSIPSRPPSAMNRPLDMPSRTQSPQPRIGMPEGQFSRPQSVFDGGDRQNAASPEQMERMRQQAMARPPSVLSRPPSSNQFKPLESDSSARSTPPQNLVSPIPQQQQSPQQNSVLSPKPPVSLSTIITPDRVKFNLPDEIQTRDGRISHNGIERPKHLSSFADLQTGKGRNDKGDNDSGVDESTQEKEKNGPASPNSPVKSPSKIPTSAAATGPIARPQSITPQTRSRSTSKQRLSAKTPETPNEPLIKKIPMNKIQVGSAPSPNLKVVRSKIGSLDNATHKPGGGNVKIENKRVEIKAAPRIAAKNEQYAPKGGDKKILSNKLSWNAKSKIGSLDNTSHKPGGGDKRIESIKTDFKDRAQPRVGSKDNLKHQPGGGDVKITTQKLNLKAQSKIGSLDNVKHKPGGGDKKIFDDKEYLKQIDHPIPPTTPPAQSPEPSGASSVAADDHLAQQS